MEISNDDRQKIKRVIRAVTRSQGEAAEKIGTSKSALCRWFNGEKTLTGETQDKLLKLAGCTWETILIFDDPASEKIANREE